MAIFPVVYLLFVFSIARAQSASHQTLVQGAIVRSDSTKQELALLFTADSWAEGLPFIRKTLKKEGVKAAFFFTGRTYRNPAFRQSIRQLAADGHYFGPHSNSHLLYCDWARRDSLLVTNDSFRRDMNKNRIAMEAIGLPFTAPQLFVPPYEWWNDSIAAWSLKIGLQLISFTPGVRTNADYTWPEMGSAYKSSSWIRQWLKETTAATPQKLNGSFILVHAGTDPRRKDKLYHHLPEIIRHLRQQGFRFRRADSLLSAAN